MRRLVTLLLTLPIMISLSGCEQIMQKLGIEDTAKKEARADAEGKSVGAGCRQSGRAIEDCYSVYNWLPKASIFAGWREMNDYMLANNLEIVEPKLPPAPPPPPPPEPVKKKKKKTAAEGEAAADTAGEKSGATEKAADSTAKSDKAESTGKEAAPEKAAKH